MTARTESSKSSRQTEAAQSHGKPKTTHDHPYRHYYSQACSLNYKDTLIKTDYVGLALAHNGSSWTLKRRYSNEVPKTLEASQEKVHQWLNNITPNSKSTQNFRNNHTTGNTAPSVVRTCPPTVGSEKQRKRPWKDGAAQEQRSDKTPARPAPARAPPAKPDQQRSRSQDSRSSSSSDDSSGSSDSVIRKLENTNKVTTLDPQHAYHNSRPWKS